MCTSPYILRRTEYRPFDGCCQSRPATSSMRRAATPAPSKGRSVQGRSRASSRSSAGPRSSASSASRASGTARASSSSARDQHRLLAEAVARDVQGRHPVGDQVGDDPVAWLGDDRVARGHQVDVAVGQVAGSSEQVAPLPRRPASPVPVWRGRHEGVLVQRGQSLGVRAGAGVPPEAEQHQRRVERQAERRGASRRGRRSSGGPISGTSSIRGNADRPSWNGSRSSSDAWPYCARRWASSGACVRPLLHERLVDPVPGEVRQRDARDAGPSRDLERRRRHVGDDGPRAERRTRATSAAIRASSPATRAAYRSSVARASISRLFGCTTPTSMTRRSTVTPGGNIQAGAVVRTHDPSARSGRQQGPAERGAADGVPEAVAADVDDDVWHVGIVRPPHTGPAANAARHPSTPVVASTSGAQLRMMVAVNRPQ